MPATHVVKSGEQLGTMARKFGCANFMLLCQQPENAALKALAEVYGD